MTKYFSPIRLAIALFIGILCTLSANAQDEKETKETLPPVENLALETKDGVLLSAKYFPGTKGKDAVPIIMLHSMIDTAATGAAYYKLAGDIQRLMGHAVIVPDLRGHGDSTKQRNPRDLNSNIPIDPNKFTKAQFAMVGLDIEACKKFLMTKNNKGELNIEKLCVIGSDVSAIVAINWAVYDWSQKSNIVVKNGQDVKALILLTPIASYKGLTAQLALNHAVIQRTLSIMILAGKLDPKYYSGSKRIYNQLTRYHLDKFTDKKDELEKKMLFEYGLDTKTQGSGMLSVSNLKPSPRNLIADFIRYRLENQAGYVWTDRTNPIK
jgi:pimeloyl-ACP methyl ester carboxylesterase|tara:strand:+ start:379 stop:1350 length:972 start_codon:yes stop_codon:yes gene_type:complete